MLNMSSSAIKRLRIFAGPNGSGKTSVYDDLRQKGSPRFGVYVNADDIERTIRDKGIVSFGDYGIKISEDALKEHFLAFKDVQPSAVSVDQFYVEDDFLVVPEKVVVDSYFAAFLAGQIRNEMLVSGIETITIETVMSHPSKLELMMRAKALDYRVYLYFITTSDPKINVERVLARTQKGGHDVPPEKVRSRYFRSLDNLYGAVLLSDRAFLIDNSERNYKLIGEYDGSVNVFHLKTGLYPEWVQKYFMEKNK